MEPEDYIEGATNLMFDEGTMDRMRCFSVEIVDDDELEMREDFTIQLSSTTAGFIDPERSAVTISILDRDGE